MDIKQNILIKNNYLAKECSIFWSTVLKVNNNDEKKQGGIVVDTKMLNYCVLNGYFKVVKWCRENGARWSTLTCAFAALGGHIDILKWCRENGAPWVEILVLMQQEVVILDY